MNRTPYASSHLACFHYNGRSCTAAELNQLGSSEKLLLAVLSYCLLSCREHIHFGHEPVTINLRCGERSTEWEVENWERLQPALRYALNEMFRSTAALPPPRHAKTAA